MWPRNFIFCTKLTHCCFCNFGLLLQADSVHFPFLDVIFLICLIYTNLSMGTTVLMFERKKPVCKGQIFFTGFTEILHTKGWKILIRIEWLISSILKIEWGGVQKALPHNNSVWYSWKLEYEQITWNTDWIIIVFSLKKKLFVLLHLFSKIGNSLWLILSLLTSSYIEYKG